VGFTESSLALNQLLMSVFCEACSTSPPIPKTTLPIIMTAKVFSYPPKPQISCPSTQNMADTIRAIRAPYLSMTMPPRRGTMMLGKA
jgi:hypothetical protein